MSIRRLSARFAPMVAAIALVSGLLLWSSSASADTAIRINTGGAAQTVNGVNWAGCTSASACGGYVKGGNPWSENPASISGITSPDSAAIEKTEWTGGSANGVPYGGTAFTFAIPVSGSNSYTVVLHFTENNKTAAGQRVFDVKLNDNTVLSNFDIFQAAGGEFKTITRSFTTAASNGAINIAFIRKTENAKIGAIEVFGSSATTTSTSAPTTSSSSTTTTTSMPSTTTSTTVPPSTTTTTAPPANNSGKLSWSSIASVPVAGVEATGGAIDNEMYVFGGYYNNNWVPTNKAYVYDTSANSWSSLPNVPKTLTHGTAIVNGRNFIVAGGYSTNSSGQQIYGITDVWNFNVDTKTWSSLPSLPAPRGSGGLAKVGNTLHFFGGVDPNRKEQTNHWTLDLNNLSAGWQAVAAVPFQRTHFATVTVGTDVYVIAGLIGVDDKSTEYGNVFKLDTTTGDWTTRTSAPIPMSHMADSTVLYGGKIYVFGGEPHFGKQFATVYVYDPAADSWTTTTSLPQARFAANAVNINGTFYFAMGSMTDKTAWKATFN